MWVRFQPDSIIHGIAEPLFAAQVSLRRLHRDMPQKELNLLQLTACLMAKTGTSAAKIVRRERRDLTILCFLLHDTPNDLGAESAAPNPASLVDRTKQRAGCNAGGGDPKMLSRLRKRSQNPGTCRRRPLRQREDFAGSRYGVTSFALCFGTAS